MSCFATRVKLTAQIQGSQSQLNRKLHSKSFPQVPPSSPSERKVPTQSSPQEPWPAVSPIEEACLYQRICVDLDFNYAPIFVEYSTVLTSRLISLESASCNRDAEGDHWVELTIAYRGSALSSDTGVDCTETFTSGVKCIAGRCVAA